MEEINRRDDRRQLVRLTVLAGQIRLAVERSWINEWGQKVTYSQALQVAKGPEARLE